MKKGKQFYEDLTLDQQAAWQEEVKVLFLGANDHLESKGGLFTRVRFFNWIMQMEHDSMLEFLSRSFVWSSSIMGYDYWYVVAMSAPHREPNNGKKQTATDWLWDQFVNKSRTDYANMLRQADAMHREQVIEAHRDGNKSNGWGLEEHEHEQYYNEKYATDYGTE